MKFSLAVISLLFTLQVHAQSILRGKVVDSLSGKPLEGITVSINEKALGATNDKGVFSITISKTSKDDVLSFENMRYLPKKIALSNFKNGQVVSLQENIRQLENVTINKRKSKTKWLYNRSRLVPKVGFAPSEDLYLPGREHAKGFVASSENLWLKRVKMVKYQLKGIPTPYRSRFILRIYDDDSLNGGPGKVLFNKEVLLDQGKFEPEQWVLKKNQHSIVLPFREDIIDLSKENIIVPGKVFYVGVEKLSIPFNEVVYVPKIKPVYPGQPLLDMPTTTIFKQYLPSICSNLFDINEIDKKFVMNWHKNKEGKWVKSEIEWAQFEDNIFSSLKGVHKVREVLIDVEVVE